MCREVAQLPAPWDALPPGYRALTAAVLTKPTSPAALCATVAGVLARARHGDT